MGVNLGSVFQSRKIRTDNILYVFAFFCKKGSLGQWNRKGESANRLPVEKNQKMCKWCPKKWKYYFKAKNQIQVVIAPKVFRFNLFPNINGLH